MDSGVLALIDILRIQGFVFASNRLKDIAAGSFLVSKATDARALAAMAAAQGGTLVYSAGGNAVLAFHTEGSARAFAGAFSRKVLDESPGLEVEIALQPFDKGGWADAFSEAQRTLERRKLSRKGQAPLLGLSVTAECMETRRVAEDVQWEYVRPGSSAGRWAVLSATTLARRRARDAADDEWKTLLPDAFDGRHWVFPDENDRLGRSSGDVSLVGLVHIDGNSVGKCVQTWLRETKEKSLANDAFQRAQRALADEINTTAVSAMKEVVQRVRAAAAWRKRTDGTREYFVRSTRTGRELLLFTDDNAICLPVRPILVGGDDITFLCDGRLALTLTRTALNAFAHHKVSSLGQPLSACAGVAIVKSHAPFSRAYTLAEELCRSAKRAVKSATPGGRFSKQDCALDWHVGHMTTLEPLESMREREYTLGTRTLHMRPYPLGGNHKSFAWLDDQLLGGGNVGFLGSAWQGHRNKIKALRDIARRGPDAVATALSNWSVTAGELASLPAGLDAGFDGNATTLLDAIELVDVHLPLD